MIVRDLTPENIDERLKTFDFFNDYRDTMFYLKEKKDITEEQKNEMGWKLKKGDEKFMEDFFYFKPIAQ